MSVPIVSIALDPETILWELPSLERERFVQEYNSALDAAHEVWRYKQLQEVLRLWSLRARAYAQPDFRQRAREAAINEPDRFVPAGQNLPFQAGGSG